MTVLYVDDDSPHHASLRQVLREAGFRLLEVNARKSLDDLLREGDFHVVVANPHALGFQQLEVLAVIKQARPETPLVLAIEPGTETVAFDALGQGADDYVVADPKDLPKLPFAIRRASLTTRMRQDVMVGNKDVTALFENTSDGLVVLSRDGDLLVHNRAAERYVALLQASFLRTPPHVAADLAARATPIDLELQLDSGEDVVLSVLLTSVSWGGKDSFLLSFRDVTQQKATEEQLHQSRELLRLVLDTVPTRIFFKDRDSRYLGCNLPFAADAGFSSPDEIVGKTDYDLGWKDQAELYRADDFAVMTTGKAKLAYEEPQTRPDGTTAWLRTSKLPLSKGTLAGGVAHDFNNLLTTIIGNAEMALLQTDETDPLWTCLEDIRAAGERGAQLTRQLLTFARREPQEPAIIDLNEHVAQTEKMIRRLLRESIEFEVKLSAEPTYVYLDPGHIDQILLNLTTNARDAMVQGGRLTIETSSVTLEYDYFKAHGLNPPRPGEYVLLSVIDTGTGMSREIQERIFDPFFTTKEVGEGTGLGLSTVYGIVKDAGGYIRCQSEPGKGTCMEICLPKMSRCEKPRAVTEVSARDLAGTETILVVEDDADVRQLTVRSLTSYGYRVMQAADPVEALDLVNQYDGRLDLVITDVVMPHMGGKQLADRLIARKPGLKVLFISGYPLEPAEAGGPGSGDFAYFQKPFTPRALAAKVREFLGK